MMSPENIETQRLMAAAWKEHYERTQERNRREAEEKRKYAVIDDAMQE